MTQLQSLTDRIEAFRDGRHWKQFHNPRDLAHELGIDPQHALLAKLERNAERYPVDWAKGSSRKYTEH